MTVLQKSDRLERPQPDEGMFAIAAKELDPNLPDKIWSGERWGTTSDATWRQYSHRRSAIRAAKKLSQKYPNLVVYIVDKVNGEKVWSAVDKQAAA